MFDAIILGSLRYRWLVLFVALVVVGLGSRAVATMPVDVLPELNAPTVTIITDARGMAPQEVERFVTIPIEQAVNGASGVRRIRSSSAVGLSLVWVEFDWDVPNLESRQIVGERLDAVRDALPRGSEPVMAPTSSIMGEIMFVGVLGQGDISPRALRDTAEWQVRRQLLAVPGVAQVVPIGGSVKQVEIVLRPELLQQHRLGMAEVTAALDSATENAAGGFMVAGAQEYVVRAIGRVGSLDELRAIELARTDGVPVLLGDISTVSMGDAIIRGQAAVDGRHAVVLKIKKQPAANTLELTSRVEATLARVGASLPEGVSLYTKGFRQAHFIETAIDNVVEVLGHAALLVVVVLFMFLLSWRTTAISLVALPLSLLGGVLVLHWMGATINTMTLGGFAIAIGELVDDAIIDVENVHRRLRENHARPPKERMAAMEVVYRASKEIRSSVVFATIILVMVFAPLFFLTGLEGRLLVPLGLAYVTSITASLLVALTVTPVLCLLLLGRGGGARSLQSSPVAGFLERRYRPVVAACLRYSTPIAVWAAVGAVAAVVALASFGRSFLPEFNEGSLNIAAATAPGVSLETSDAIVARLEKKLLGHPKVTSVIRSTGRAERDEHALDVNYSELEVGLSLEEGEREQVFAEIRELAAEVPGLSVTVGQPISHRIEHMVSGVRSSIAVKFFGDDLEQLRVLAQRARTRMSAVQGVVDLQVEQQTEIPQLIIEPRNPELAQLGRSPGGLARHVHMALVGHRVATWWEEERAYDVVVQLPKAYRQDAELLEALPVDAAGERYAELGQVAHIEKTMAPNLINRENAQRRLVVTANVAGRDLRGTAEAVREAVEQIERPPGYRLEVAGEFEREARATQTIVWLSALVVLAMFAMLSIAFGSARDAALVLVNLPLALVGGVVAVWIGGGVLTLATLVGFVTLFGIASRNGILMITRYRRLLQEGLPVEDAVRQGSVDRLIPILMTALTAALALVPLVLAIGEPGNEIQGPMAAVILGGLVSSTLLNLVVVPALYARFTRPPVAESMHTPEPSA